MGGWLDWMILWVFSNLGDSITIVHILFLAFTLIILHPIYITEIHKITKWKKKNLKALSTRYNV